MRFRPRSPDPPIRLTPRHLPRHTAVMAVVYSVLSEDKGEAQAALQRLCDAFGLETSGPVLMLSGKWLGRARKTWPPAPPED